MIRYEVKTPHKSFVGCEDTIEAAKSYIASIVDAGVEVTKVEYFDNDQRIDLWSKGCHHAYRGICRILPLVFRSFSYIVSL